MVAEKEREPEEGEAQKSPSTIVAESLSHISRSSTFLPNIGVLDCQDWPSLIDSSTSTPSS